MKTVEEIYGEMLACYGERTGLEPEAGCDLSARLYALAAQVCALYVQADWVVRQAFPQSAEGEYLDRHALLRGLERKEAAAAGGVVRFTAGSTAGEARSIPKGTVCMTAGLIRFETTEEGTIPAGELTAEVPVRALVPGASGNVAAGTITEMAVAPAGVSACTNPQACAGGGDREEDAELRERVLDTFRRLPNGANAAYYQREALSFDQVAGAAVVPRPRGVGTADVVVTTLAGLPGQDLLDLLEAHFQERREIAVDLRVRAPETVTVDLTVQVSPGEGWSFAEAQAEAETALRNWFTGKRLGQSVLRAQLGNLVYGCESVANYAITAPAADVAVASDVLPILGTLTVEEMA